MCNCQCPIEMLIILSNPVCLDQAGAVLISKKVTPKKVRKQYGIKVMWGIKERYGCSWDGDVRCL